ncbi:hypothetical protein [Psychrobacillus sp. L3]|uniref:hypothetical protein n=1 Tax=Psychrobacillus sp. L3 TaxID=3236891 RepID=UPI0036F381D5
MLEDLISINLPRALPNNLIFLIILHLIRNSSDKLHEIFTLKRLYIFWVTYWIINSVFYFDSLGEIMSGIISFSLILLLIPLVLIILIRKLVRKRKDKREAEIDL